MFDFAGDVTIRIAAVFAIFALGGFVKGVIAHGLPLVTVPLLSNFFPVPVAIALALPAIVLSNAYQSACVGRPVANIKRLWPMLLTFALTIAFTVNLLVRLDTQALLGFVGLIAVAFALNQLMGFKLEIAPERERAAGIAAGFLAGVMGGMTSLFSTPVILFLTTIKLGRDDFVNALSLMLLTGSFIITVALARFDIYTGEIVALSVAAIVPLGAGYALGAGLRRRLNREIFMRIIFSVLMALGVWMMVKGWLL